MMTGRELYHRICDAGSIDAEVARMSRDELAETAEYLSDIGASGGVPAQVFGAVSLALVGKQPKPGRKQATTRRKGAVA